MVDSLPIVAFVLALAALPVIAMLVVRRFRLAYHERRAKRLESRVAPLALALVDGEPADGSGLTRLEAETLAGVLERYAQVLNGESRARVAAFFEGSGTVELEISRLRSRRGWRRATAAKTLGDMSSSTAAPALIEALEDRDAAVRSAAARGLGRLGYPDSVEPLVRALASGNIPRAAAGLALLQIGSAAVPALLGMLDSDDEYVRATSVELIGRLGCASEGERILCCLDDPSAEVRARASRALGRLATADAATRLRQALHARMPFERAAAAVGLGRVGDGTAVDELIEAARRDSYTPAKSAAQAAARIAPASVTAAAQEPGAGAHLQELADRIAWGVA